MIHYSCDKCGKSIAADDLRYLVRLEANAMLDVGDDDPEDDRDHLMEIEEILERMDDAECEALGGEIYQKQRFDMCTECYRKFMRNPLGMDQSVQFEFSDN